MIHYVRVTNPEELQQILELQHKVIIHKELKLPFHLVQVTHLKLLIWVTQHYILQIRAI